MFYRFIGLAGFGVSALLFSYHYNRRFMDWLRFQSLGTRDYIVERLALMFYDKVSPQQILIGQFAISFGLGTIVFLIFLPKLFPGVLFAVAMTIVGWKAPKPFVDHLYNKRVDKFVLQMVDGLSLMSNGLKSGLSVAQSLGLVVQEMPDPIRQEFNLILSENKLGVSLEEAFSNLAKRIQVDDVEMFVTSINILKETGGNLAETFDTIVTTIRERIKVEKKIASMTAAGFYQGIIVMCIPLVLGVVFYQSDPEFMRPLFTTPIGWIIIMVIMVLEIVGYFVIMRIVKIDV